VGRTACQDGFPRILSFLEGEILGAKKGAQIITKTQIIRENQ